MLKQVKNILKNLDGDCHLCTGKLTEITVGANIKHNKRVLCLNCKAGSDSFNYGNAYLLFSEIN